MRTTFLLFVAILLGGCATIRPAQLTLPHFERTNLEQDEFDEVARQLPALIGCVRARRRGCGLEEDYLEYFEGQDIEQLFGSDRVESIWYHPDHRGDSGTIEVQMDSAVFGAWGVIVFELRGGHWRPVDAAMLVF